MILITLARAARGDAGNRFATNASLWMQQCVHLAFGETSLIFAQSPVLHPDIALAPSVHTPTNFSQLMSCSFKMSLSAENESADVAFRV